MTDSGSALLAGVRARIREILGSTAVRLGHGSGGLQRQDFVPVVADLF